MRRVLILGAVLLLAALAVSLVEDPAPATSSPTGSPLAPETTQQPTEVNAISDRCKANGPEQMRELIEQLAELCEPAAATVDQAWGTSWAQGSRQRTQLTIAGGVDELAELLKRTDTKGLVETAAVTVGPKNAPADAVFVNGPAFVELSDLGREVVLTHELVHVAARATGDSAAPTWLEEGFADYVAYRYTDLLPRQVAEEALAAPLPEALPATDDFDAAGAEVAVAYGRSWAAVMLLAERLGSDAAVKSFYERTVDAGIGDALRSAGFENENDFVQAWRQEIEELAAA
ncbi:gluzincin family metallopeptidase [Kineosporia babensis]|uniref:Peptidase MA superfamily protein n=1 Tax=Kineosporia babensis TaxID=499548 RepID=A0A9X1NDZ4_9ACTN|nr:hypothetical protein [Kineosporia babensis]MCD5311541.1 hypothetical protein [Kineosporia babensis]